MIDKEKLHERYMRDPLPRRLGGLAATLGRISSSAMKSNDRVLVSDLIEEAKRLIEWTAGEVKPEEGAELIRIQILLSIWQKAWEKASFDPDQRLLLSLLAKDWSDKALDFSGLA